MSNPYEPTPPFRMPAEWEPHHATWLTWPHDELHWRELPEVFAHMPAVWARMVKELEEGEDVHIAVHNDEVEAIIKKAFKEGKVQGDRVHLHRIPNNFCWMRDHGAIGVKDAKNQNVLLHWRYTAYAKWQHDLDDAIPYEMQKIMNMPMIDIPMVFEGGSIDVNGKGTVLTTESCLLNKNRNPDMTKEQIEEQMKKYLGVTNILWLGGGIEGDDTDGHVDDLTRFVNPTTVVTATEENPDDVNYAPLKENYERLQTMKDQDGNPLSIIKLPMPAPVVVNPERLPASYANFYIGNKVILLTVFDDPNDAVAIDALQKCFPDRKIAAIPARDLVVGFGAFHCATQQWIK